MQALFAVAYHHDEAAAAAFLTSTIVSMEGAFRDDDGRRRQFFHRPTRFAIFGFQLANPPRAFFSLLVLKFLVDSATPWSSFIKPALLREDRVESTSNQFLPSVTYSNLKRRMPSHRLPTQPVNTTQLRKAYAS
jgi:hypothetical protein